jgi:hypothetical protein
VYLKSNIDHQNKVSLFVHDRDLFTLGPQGKNGSSYGSLDKPLFFFFFFFFLGWGGGGGGLFLSIVRYPNWSKVSYLR